MGDDCVDKKPDPELRSSEVPFVPPEVPSESFSAAREVEGQPNESLVRPDPQSYHPDSRSTQFQFGHAPTLAHAPGSLPMPLPMQMQMQMHPGPAQAQGNLNLMQDPTSMQFYYESRMRDHAAAYASAAAGAAWAAAQIAQAAASNINAQSLAHHQQLPMRLPEPPFMMHPAPGIPQVLNPRFPAFVPQSPLSTGSGVPENVPNHALQNERLQHQNNGGKPARSSCTDPESADKNENDPASDTSYSNLHRRKRQQRMPPSETIHESYASVNMNDQRLFQGRGQDADESDKVLGQKRGSRRRNRYDNSPANSENEQLPSSKSRRRKTFRRLPSSGSDGANSASGLYRRHPKRKQQQPSDESLLGKTGVSALFEWAHRRKLTPVFEILPPDADSANAQGVREYFEITASIGDVEYGRGQGHSKTIAKQEAARNTLLAVFPGIEFEPITGVVIGLPEKDHGRRLMGSPLSTMNSLEDLAPHLAKRLAIGHDDDADDKEREATSNKNDAPDAVDSKKRHGPQIASSNLSASDVRKQKRLCPGSFTTTSEEEDEDTYYTSRGASVCSVLLHAMVQIDERIPDPPVYTFQNMTIPLTTNAQLKRKAGYNLSGSSATMRTPSAVIDHRGPFTCFAKLSVKSKEDLTDRSNVVEDSTEPQLTLLEATGAGATKREARHIASAKLLALLFPECDGMAQVKLAAEAFRENYAAEKLVKNKVKLDSQGSADVSAAKDEPPKSQEPLASEKKQVIDLEAQKHEKLNEAGAETETETNENGQDSPGPFAGEEECGEKDTKSAPLKPEEFSAKVTQALQRLNNHDAGGRRIPDELTENDVGRTVLRQAHPSDAHWIESLFGQSNLTHHRDSATDAISILKASPSNGTEVDSEQTGEADATKSAPSIVLLLCRAIAPYDDPPLGCAVLTASEDPVCLLRVSQIVTKTHLPQERFVECLQSFAESIDFPLECCSSKE